MAHQTENIPWNDIASIIRPEFHNKDGISKLVAFASKDVQLGRVRSFAAKFEQTLKREAQLERQKYPKFFETAQDNETVISDELADQILPTMKRWITHLGEEEYIHGEADNESTKFIPRWSRKMYAFTVPWNGWNIVVKQPAMANGHELGDFQLEIVKSLLVHGQIEPVLKICAHPMVVTEAWHHASRDGYEQGNLDGWDMVYLYALHHYIFFNLLYQLSNTWHREMEDYDYRDLESFQLILRGLSQEIGHSEICTHPHRSLLGTPDRHESSHIINRTKCGIMPFPEFTKSFGYDPSIHIMTRETIRLTRFILTARKIPLEIQDHIITLTGQERNVENLLKVPYDPLHPANRALLFQYVDRCWKLLLHCQMLSEVGGNVGSTGNQDMVMIDWAAEIGMSLSTFFQLELPQEFDML